MADEIDSRMETIRLKEEELEKKHKEILEDELEAKKQGAIVSLKENVTKKESKHRYDDVDLDFDVNEDQKQNSKNPNYSKPKNVRKPTLDKKHLDEIPPDPVNFLREDVDGEKSSDGPQPPQDQKQHANNRNRRNQRPHQSRGNNQGGEKPEGNNQEGRSRQHRPRPPQNRNAQDNNGSNSQNSSTSPRKIHPQALRTERRQLATESSNNEEQQAEKSPSHANRPRRPIQKQQPPRPITKDGNRNNLTVQITDEVRSVKIKPTERVGSGRVGHNIQAENLEGQESPEKPQSADGNRNRNKNPRHKRNFKPKPQNPEFQHPILEKIVVSKTSVQERLLRVKSDDGGAQEEPKVVGESNEPAAPEIIESSK